MDEHIDPVDGDVDRVEDLAEGHGGRPDRPGVLVRPGVGDDEGLGGREHGVEQQLAVLAADVALAGHRVARSTSSPSVH